MASKATGNSGLTNDKLNAANSSELTDMNSLEDPMMTESTEAKRGVEEVLRAAHACPMCVLRYSQCTDHTQYVALIDAKQNSEETCPMCIGVLQHCRTYCEAIVSALEASPFEIKKGHFDVYNVRISTPTTWVLRDDGMRAYVKQETGISLQTTAVKEVAKYIVDEFLNARWPVLTHEVGAAFHVDLEIQHLEQELESQFFHYCGASATKTKLYNRRSGGNKFKRIKMQDVCQQESKLSLAQCMKLTESHMKSPSDYNAIGLCPPKSTSILEAEEAKDYAKSLPQRTISSKYTSPVPTPVGCAGISFTVTHQAVYVSGYYCKYSRELSQTPWFIGDSRMTASSTEEEITKFVLPYFGKTVEVRFHSSGREDRDVRMLGSGRLFFLELLNICAMPTMEKYAEMQRQVNEDGDGMVAISNFHLSDLQSFNAMNRGIADKQKTYRAVCYSERVITPDDLKVLHTTEPFVLKQLTPIRVLHRRNLQTRNKTVHEMTTHFINAHFFLLDLRTQSGTYIKEFVHGDRGRTVPNVCDLLGTTCQILQLDVMGLVDKNPPIETTMN